MSRPRILIAGIGNIFFRDDAFGCEVARRLVELPLPAGVQARDFGIRGLDLAYELNEKHDVVLLIDAMKLGKPPGSLTLLEPDPGEELADRPEEWLIGAHDLDPLKVIRVARMINESIPRVLVLGCEPTSLELDEDGTLGLSDAVQLAVAEALQWIRRLLDDLLGEDSAGQPSLGDHRPPAETGQAQERESC